MAERFADEEIHQGKTALQHEVDLLYKPPSHDVGRAPELTVADVKRLIDEALMSWMPHSLKFQKLIDDAMKLALKEHTQTSEGQSALKEKKAMREMVKALNTKVEECCMEMKTTKTFATRLKSLEARIDRTHVVLMEVQQESKDGRDRLLAEILRVEKKCDESLTHERAKRMSLFNRFAKKHFNDLENLKLSVQDNLSKLQQRNEKEWQEQEKLLGILREKLDMALIRRLGYLPAPSTTTDAGYGSNMYSTMQSDRWLHSLPQPVSKVGTASSPGLEDLVSRQRQDAGISAEKRDCLSTYSPRPITARRGLEIVDDASVGDSSVETVAIPISTLAPIPITSSSGREGEYLAFPGMFDQGLDAAGLIESMDCRMEDLAGEIERLRVIQAGKAGIERLVKERNRREAIGIFSDVEDAYYDYNLCGEYSNTCSGSEPGADDVEVTAPSVTAKVEVDSKAKVKAKAKAKTVTSSTKKKASSIRRPINQGQK